MQVIERKLKETTESDEKIQDRRRAFYLDMSYDAYSKRKVELMAQARKLKEAKTA